MMTTIYIGYNVYHDYKAGSTPKDEAVTVVLSAVVADLVTSGIAIFLWSLV